MLRSSVSGVTWPAIVLGEGSTLLAAAFQLEQSQWWSPEELEAHQRRQLATLVRHARANVPFYRTRLDGVARAITPERWRAIPWLTKDDLRRRRADLLARRVPAGHLETHARSTSGSSGEPAVIAWTAVATFFWKALALRDDLWHRRDPRARVVAIRSGREAEDPLAVYDEPGWSVLPEALCPSGPATVLYHRMPIARQAAILEARRPHYLIAYPSNARALCQWARRQRLRLPELRAVHTYGEPLTPDVRVACRETWGVPTEDVYSCEEVGMIALQCPEHEHYHVQSESVLVEVLDEEGRPVAPGETGHLVLTSLHNLAMPLLRYAVGDFAEVGPPCPCGRGLPVLTRIHGRARNRASLPNGRHAWPDAGALWAAIPRAERVQCVQRASDAVLVRYAPRDALPAAEQQAAAARIRAALGYPFRVTFEARDTIPRHPNGKYETFVDPR